MEQILVLPLDSNIFKGFILYTCETKRLFLINTDWLIILISAFQTASNMVKTEDLAQLTEVSPVMLYCSRVVSSTTISPSKGLKDGATLQLTANTNKHVQPQQKHFFKTCLICTLTLKNIYISTEQCSKRLALFFKDFKKFISFSTRALHIVILSGVF